MANDLTTLRDTPAFAAGKFGNAITSGVLGTTTDLNSAVGTLEAWVRSTAIAGTRVAVGNSGTATNGIWIGMAGSGMATSGLPASAGPTATTPAINDGAWHHLALTIDGTNAKLWVDGTLAATSAYAGTFNLGNGVAGTLAVGGYGASASYDWMASGLTAAIDEVRVSNIVRYTSAFTPSASAFTADANAVALYHLNGNGTDSGAGAGPTITPNDANILFSPYNWDVTGARAATINPGAYFRTAINNASSITLNFDMAGVSSPVPRIKVRVDGGGWTAYDLAATVALTIPTENTWSTHTVEVVVAATSEFVNRWNPQSAIVKFTGIMCAGTSVATRAGTAATANMLVFGDSITEGYKTLKNVTTPDGSDSSVGWAYLQRSLLGVEVGVVGFGAQGWVTGGQGGVPALPTAYTSLWGSGPARSFSAPAPDVIVINMGENDGASDITATVTSFLNALLTAAPTAKIAVMRPFSGAKAAQLQAGIGACSVPSRVTYIDTTGWWSSADALDGQHPTGYASQNALGPKLANALRTAGVVGGSGGSGRYVNVGGVAKLVGTVIKS